MLQMEDQASAAMGKQTMNE